MAIQTLNPYTNKVEHRFDAISDVKIKQAIDDSHTAFLEWKNTSVEQRAQLLLNVADLLEKNARQYAALMTREMGKLFKEGIEWEIPNCIDMCRYYAANAGEFLKDQPILDVETGSANIESLPMGVIFGVMPWNFPFYQVIRFAVPNIMAGNTVLFKHASNVPQCAIALAELFAEAGFPKGIVTSLLMSASQSELIISDKRVQGVSLTGSERAGSSVAALAGKYLKKVVMELGGNDPFIVLADADVEKAADLALVAKMFNSGEVCTGAKRFIIAEEIYDEFLALFTQKMAAMKAGDPMDMATDYAPLVSEIECQSLLEQVHHAVEQGATLVLGGEREPLPGAWLKPTILTDVTQQMDIFDRELFGPIAVVYKVSSEQQAIELANNSSYGLSSAIISQNESKARSVASKLETGVSFINSFTISEPCLPFGGVKNSGFGRELGRAGMEEFINKKLVRSL
ncbi:NAD-dependent succinate-semialdehyde dehydrogenase [Vibrio caribbeanicus]|uniref:Succinate-semialdehyde dehydrogenase (NADP+) n=1 Tax=Vibrio caribbeanicus ATCC BAA-2122 TaxID=796620 RepID=E3BJQ5_9VIBR|nr:NAD-dependent succinate-semialdehyde dehydrogenase [Vibrio caribbeanicus]EFP96824.1 succinate-semialdehyde dehydrogenase (NADP+) [Vibrio caribbeanicus ATCC BAA-2122]